MTPALRSLTWWVGVGILVLVGFAVYHAGQWQLGGRLFPWVIGFAILGVAAVHTVLGLVRGVRAKRDAFLDGVGDDTARRTQVLFATFGFLILVALLGHTFAVPIFIVAYMVYEGERPWLALLVAAGVSAFMHVVLERVLHVSFPTGMLLQWFGL